MKKEGFQQQRESREREGEDDAYIKIASFISFLYGYYLYLLLLFYYIGYFCVNLFFLDDPCTTDSSWRVRLIPRCIGEEQDAIAASAAASSSASEEEAVEEEEEGGEEVWSGTM